MWLPKALRWTCHHEPLTSTPHTQQTVLEGKSRWQRKGLPYLEMQLSPALPVSQKEHLHLDMGHNMKGLPRVTQPPHPSKPSAGPTPHSFPVRAAHTARCGWDLQALISRNHLLIFSLCLRAAALAPGNPGANAVLQFTQLLAFQLLSLFLWHLWMQWPYHLSAFVLPD